MATMPQRQALEIIREMARQTPELYRGYRDELIGTMVEIMSLESVKSHGFAKEIGRKIEVLGEKLEREGYREE